MTEHVKSPADGGAFYWGAVKTVDTVGKNAMDKNGREWRVDTGGHGGMGGTPGLRLRCFAGLRNDGLPTRGVTGAWAKAANYLRWHERGTAAGCLEWFVALESGAHITVTGNLIGDA